MVDTRDLKSLAGNRVPVRVRSPAPEKGKSEQDFPFSGATPSARVDPLRSNAKEDSRPLSRSSHADPEVGSDLDCSGAPRRSPLRTARKRQARKRLPFPHLCSVAPPSQIEPASLGFDLDTGSGLNGPGAAPSARVDPLRSNAKEDSCPLSRSSHANLKVGSDLDCSVAPRQNKAIRSCGGTGTATSTDDLVFPFQPRPADAGLAADRETGWIGIAPMHHVAASFLLLAVTFYAPHQKSPRAHSAAAPFRKRSRSARLPASNALRNGCPLLRAYGI